MNPSPPEIDWSRTQEKLREAQITIERASSGDEQRMRRAYQERARRLAMPRETSATGKDRMRLLGFRLDKERYGIELCHVTQVYPAVPITPVPGSAPAILGVANLEGSVRSVLGLRKLLGLPDKDTEAPQYILLMRYHGRQLGLHIEHVEAVHDIARDTLITGQDDDVDAFACLVLGVTADHRTVLRPDALFDHHMTGRQRTTTCANDQATAFGDRVELGPSTARDVNH